MSSASQDYATIISPNTPSSVLEPIFGRESEMVQNNTEGFVFKTGVWTALNRFLILGTEKNTYYSTKQKLTKDAAVNVISAIAEDGIRVVQEIVKISDEGRAAKNDSAIFALALCQIYGDLSTRQAVEENILNVCRIPTHLFDFVSVIKTLGKWNSSTKRVIANWYHNKKDLEFSVLKYQQRNGWSHRDVLRLAHVKPNTPDQDALFHWIATQGEVSKPRDLPLTLVQEYEFLRDNPNVYNAIEAVYKFGFTHEMIPRELLKSPNVWVTMLPKMGLTALIRNLGRLSSLELTKPLTSELTMIIDKLTNEEALQKARIHPINILSAMKVYERGAGVKGNLTWTVNQQIVKALEDAFYLSFKYIEPTNKNYLIAIDCSGSMFSNHVIGLEAITAAEVSAVFAMAIMKTEKNHHVVGFSRKCKPLAINANMSLKEVMHVIRKFDWNSTDFSQVASYAQKEKLDVDVILAFTDNEVNEGRHPTQALHTYRKEMNKPECRQIICATSCTDFTVSDPTDPLQMDLVGFDSAVPALVSQFVLGLV